jgi:hypothetical protein
MVKKYLHQKLMSEGIASITIKMVPKKNDEVIRIRGNVANES